MLIMAIIMSVLACVVGWQLADDFLPYWKVLWIPPDSPIRDAVTIRPPPPGPFFPSEQCEEEDYFSDSSPTVKLELARSTVRSMTYPD